MCAIVFLTVTQQLPDLHHKLCCQARTGISIHLFATAYGAHRPGEQLADPLLLAGQNLVELSPRKVIARWSSLMLL